jgi:nitrite reductase (NO-forming)
LTSRVLVLALSTGHKVGLAVVGAAFIAFALASSFLFPRFRPQYPGHGLRAFIVVALVFFFGMLAAVEVFGAEPKESKAAEHETSSGPAAPTTGTTTQATTTQATTTQATTSAATTTAAKAQTVDVTESEFKIVLATTALKAGPITFQIKNDGAIEHDLAITGGPKSKLIPSHGSGTLTATLKPGTVELYCTVPGHKAAGMDLKVHVA